MQISCFELLCDISRLFMSDNNIKENLNAILLKSSEILGMTRGMITILNRKTHEIYIRQASGISTKEMELGRYKTGEGITGKVVLTGKAVYIERISKEPSFLDRTGARKKLNTENISFFCVPVRYGNETIGTLSFDREYEGGFVPDIIMKTLEIIAAMISQAVRIYQYEFEEIQLLEEDNKRMHEELKEKFHPSNIIGSSKAMANVYSMIDKVRNTSSSVLILGESGTGKELIANAIHYNSLRADKPFIKFNCAAIPETLIESELFGHDKGAYTGAVNDRKGRFELADTGTIFLDEIGEISMAVQAKLLRVIQEREIERLGSSRVRKLDVRIIAATNRNLEEKIWDKTFRADLYYRLAVFPVVVPALRNRKTDIPLLADYFVDKYNKAHNKSVRRISTPAIDALISYHWPGNARELENCIERAVIMTEENVIHVYHLPPSLQTAESSSTKYSGVLDKVVEKVEYEMIIEKLKEHAGNITVAAKELGVTERILGLRLKKYSIDYKVFRA